MNPAVAVAAAEGVPPVDRKSRQRREGKSGQAMIEFMLGLVGIMFLLVGLLQARELSWNIAQMNLDVRGELAEQMLEEVAETSNGQMLYSEGHDVGEDGLMYTDDDNMLSTTPFGFSEMFLEYVGYTEAGSLGGDTAQEYLENYSLNDPYEALEEITIEISDTFDMIYQAGSVEVDVLPFMQSLIGKTSIELDVGIWMPRLGGLMDK